jgi:hypothetical protein
MTTTVNRGALEEAQRKIRAKELAIEALRADLVKNNARMYYGEHLDKMKALEKQCRELSAMKSGYERRAK